MTAPYDEGFAAALQEAADLARQGLPGGQGDKELAKAILALDMKHRGERAQEFWGEPEGMATHEQSDVLDRPAKEPTP